MMPSGNTPEKPELGKRTPLGGPRESRKGRSQEGHPQVCRLSRQTCFSWWPRQRPSELHSLCAYSSGRCGSKNVQEAQTASSPLGWCWLPSRGGGSDPASDTPEVAAAGAAERRSRILARSRFPRHTLGKAAPPLAGRWFGTSRLVALVDRLHPARTSAQGLLVQTSSAPHFVSSGATSLPQNSDPEGRCLPAQTARARPIRRVPMSTGVPTSTDGTSVLPLMCEGVSASHRGREGGTAISNS